MEGSNKNEKLKWMYDGNKAHVNQEDYLLGKRIGKDGELAGASGSVHIIEHEILPASVARRDVGDLQVDLARKIQEDPLFQIRKAEDNSLQEIMDNPIKLRQYEKLSKAQWKRHKHEEGKQTASEKGSKKGTGVSKNKKHKLDALDRKLLEKMSILVDKKRRDINSDTSDSQSSSTSDEKFKKKRTSSRKKKKRNQKEKKVKKRHRRPRSSSSSSSSTEHDVSSSSDEESEDDRRRGKYSDKKRRTDKPISSVSTKRGSAGEKVRPGQQPEKSPAQKRVDIDEKLKMKKHDRRGSREKNIKRDEDDDRGRRRKDDDMQRRGRRRSPCSRSDRDRSARNSHQRDQSDQRSRAVDDTSRERRRNVPSDIRGETNRKMDNISQRRSGDHRSRDESPRRSSATAARDRQPARASRECGDDGDEEQAMEKKRKAMMENARWQENRRVENLKEHLAEKSREHDRQLLAADKTAEADFIAEQWRRAADASTVESRVRSNLHHIQRRSDTMHHNFARR